MLLDVVSKGTRDNARTPIQWDSSINAGFTTLAPWIKVNPNYKEINVKKALEDPNSIYYYYKKLIALRKENPIMIYGKYIPLMEEDEKLFVYKRAYEGKDWLIIMNFSKDNIDIDFNKIIAKNPSKLILGNYLEEAEILRPRR